MFTFSLTCLSIGIFISSFVCRRRRSEQTRGCHASSERVDQCCGPWHASSMAIHSWCWTTFPALVSFYPISCLSWCSFRWFSFVFNLGKPWVNHGLFDSQKKDCLTSAGCIRGHPWQWFSSLAGLWLQDSLQLLNYNLRIPSTFNMHGTASLSPVNHRNSKVLDNS